MDLMSKCRHLNNFVIMPSITQIISIKVLNISNFLIGQKKRKKLSLEHFFSYGNILKICINDKPLFDDHSEM